MAVVEYLINMIKYIRGDKVENIFFKAKNDDEAEESLKNMGFLNYKKECPYCGSSEVYFVRRNHVKCKKCRKEWSKYRGTFLENIRIKPLLFLRIIEGIAEGRLLKNISEDLKVSYNTVLKVRNRIKEGIIKEVFEIDNPKGFITIGLKADEKGLNLKIIKDINLNTEYKRVYRIGKLYILEDFEEYDHVLVISEKSIEKLDNLSTELRSDEFRTEVKNFIEDIIDKIKRGKIVNAPTILYTIANSTLKNNHKKEYIMELLISSFAESKI